MTVGGITLGPKGATLKFLHGYLHIERIFRRKLYSKIIHTIQDICTQPNDEFYLYLSPSLSLCSQHKVSSVSSFCYVYASVNAGVTLCLFRIYKCMHVRVDQIVCVYECVPSNIVHDLVKYWRNTQLCSTSLSRCIYLCIIVPNNPR